MYYKEKLTKNLADLNTFETSNVLKGLRYNLEMNLNPLSIYIMYTLPSSGSRGAKILQQTPAEKSQ